MPTFPPEPAGQSPAPAPASSVPASSAHGGAQPSASADPSPEASTSPASPTPAELGPTPVRASGVGERRQLTFTSSQAARYLGVSLATIRRWTDAGHVDCYRTPGGQRRFSKDQLDGFVDSLQGGQGHPSRRAA